MSKASDDEEDVVRLQIELAVSNGFNCHVCGCTRFSHNAMGLVICEDCAVVYHIHVLKEIYKK